MGKIIGILALLTLLALMTGLTLFGLPLGHNEANYAILALAGVMVLITGDKTASPA